MVEIRKKTWSEWVVMIKKASRFKCVFEQNNTPNEQGGKGKVLIRYHRDTLCTVLVQAEEGQSPMYLYVRY